MTHNNTSLLTNQVPYQGCPTASGPFPTGLSRNTDKTEAIVIGTWARQRAIGTIISLTIGSTVISTANHVHSLGNSQR